MTPTATDQSSNQREHIRLLPDGWRWVRLGEVCELNPRRPDLKRDNDALTSFVSMSSVEESGRGIARAELKPFSEVRKGYTYFGERDVLFAKITPCMQNGKHAIARNLVDGIGFGSTEFHVLRPKSDTISEWIHQFVLQPWVLQEATAYFSGAVGQQRVPEDYLAGLEVPLPPLAEQQRIAAILTEQMAAVERARAAAEAQVEAAKALPAAYLRAVFNSLEAKQWPRKQLGEVCELLPSKSIATNGDTVVQAITTACLAESGFQPSGIKLARMWAKDAIESVVAPGEVLVARSNTPELVGRTAMFSGEPKDVVASDLTIRILPRSDLRSEFLTGYLSYLYLSGYWKERAGGASGSMKKITRTQIQNEQILVPSLTDQHRIAAQLTDQMTAVERARKALDVQLAAITALPAALLRQAFSGEL